MTKVLQISVFSFILGLKMYYLGRAFGLYILKMSVLKKLCIFKMLLVEIFGSRKKSKIGSKFCIFVKMCDGQTDGRTDFGADHF